MLQVSTHARQDICEWYVNGNMMVVIIVVDWCSHHGEEFLLPLSTHPPIPMPPLPYRSYSGLDFVSNMLTDKTDDGSILPDKCDELIASIEKAQVAAPKKKKDDNTGPLKEIIAAYEAQKAAAGQGDERPSKKKKQQAVELYAEYKGLTADKLKDILKWNRQIMTGNKDILLFKVRSV
jgi:hypothetical protein